MKIHTNINTASNIRYGYLKAMLYCPEVKIWAPAPPKACLNPHQARISFLQHITFRSPYFTRCRCFHRQSSRWAINPYYTVAYKTSNRRIAVKTTIPAPPKACLNPRQASLSFFTPYRQTMISNVNASPSGLHMNSPG